MRWAAHCALSSSLAVGLAGCAVDTHVRYEDDAGADAGADGGRGTRDSGPRDGCDPGIEICNDSDDDCDGRIDEGFALATDRNNCGDCGVMCPADPPSGSYRCRAGSCELRCDREHLECDGDPANGCEPVTTAARCGTCDTTCVAGTPFCDTSGSTPTCVAVCGAGATLCGDTCVDLSYSPSHCGACDRPCPDPPNAAPTCSGGACSIACDDAAYDNCDGDDENGCESLRSLENCGVCGAVCAEVDATASCETGDCMLACDPPHGDCDGMGSNGCEESLDTLTSCGFCGVACDPAHASGVGCSGGTCGYEDCDTGFGDCDASVSNGCETDVVTSTAHCGGCAQPCGLTFVGAPQVCTSGLCFPTCSGTSCLSPCTSCSCSATCTIGCAATCSPTCTGGSANCNVLADRRDRLDGRCQSGAVCTFSAQNAADVDVRCENTGTRCTVRCGGAESCDVVCTSGASCTLFCNGATSCGFTDCEGGERDCGGGHLVCNRGC